MPRCIVKDCTVKDAKYNLPGIKTNCVCRGHADLTSMVNVYVRKCIEEGCLKQASFNYKGQKTKLYCAQHKKSLMFDCSHKYCENAECAKLPSFNYENEKTPRFCADHKLENMVMVHKQKLCEYEGCKVIAYFNHEGETSAKFCATHKESSMVSIRNSGVCIEEGCRKFAVYNHPSMSKALYCKQHKRDGMHNVKTKSMCIHEGCKTTAHYNYSSEKNGLYCATHRLPTMIDISKTYCLTENCSIQLREPRKYKGYCFRCFIYNFPDEPITFNYKVKERHVVDYLKEQFSDVELITDKVVQGGCSKKRPDVFIECFTHSIIVEIDEDQHSDYTCENKRMMEIFEDLGNRPIVFIRFNPDAYIDKDGNPVKSCFDYHKTLGTPYISEKDDWNNRLTKLADNICEYMEKMPEKEVTIINLFYNKTLT